MSRPDESVLDRLREPAYTGENRCHPCTVLNVAIAVVLSAVVARERSVLGALVLAGSLLVIYLRGYLVPGTPELTKRYLPRSALQAVGKDPVAERLEDEFVTDADAGETADADESAEPDETADAPADPSDEGAVEVEADPRENGEGDASHDGTEATDDTTAGDAEDAAAEAEDAAAATVEDDEPEFRTLEKIRQLEENEIDVESYLQDAGVIEPGEADGDSITDGYVFTEEFAAGAREHLPEDPATVGPERVAPIFDVDPDELADKERDYPAYRVGVRVRKWPSAAALAMDVAAYEAIDEFADDWEQVPIEQRVDVVEWLRGFYETCPVCGGEVTFSDDIIESCCGQFNVTTLSCTDCEVHIREFDPTKVGNRRDLTGIVP